MQCPNCEKEIDDNSTSCIYCGETIMNNMKKHFKVIIMIIVGLLIVIIPIALIGLSRPLDIVYHSEFGNYYVQSDCSDKYYYKISFVSSGTVTPEATAIIPLMKPNIIIRSERLPASVSGRIGEPLVFESRVRWSNGNGLLNCHSLNGIFKTGIENGIIQLEFDERFASKLK